MSSLSSDELNYLVLRYLLESGFVHSAFSFSHESLVTKSNINPTDVPPGALVTFLQKGLQYTEIETHVNEDGTEVSCDNEFSLLQPHVCNPLGKRTIFNPREPIDVDYGVKEVEKKEMFVLTSHTGMILACQWHPTRPILATASVDGTTILWDLSPEARGISKKVISAGIITQSYDEISRQTEAILENSLILYPSHPDGIFDETIPVTKKRRISDDDDELNNLTHNTSGDVMVSLAWNLRGNKLAIGTFDGRVYVYNTPNTNTQPHIAHILENEIHKCPISVIRFSRSRNDKNELLLTGSVDGSICVWDHAGKRRIGIDKEVTKMDAILDGDWRDNSVFAVGGIDTINLDAIPAEDLAFEKKQNAPAPNPKDRRKKDKKNVTEEPFVDPVSKSKEPSSVWIYNVNYPKSPILKLVRAHRGDVTAIRWCPQGYVLATGAYDGVIKLWRPVLTPNNLMETIANQDVNIVLSGMNVDGIDEVFPHLVPPRRHGKHLFHTLLGHERGITCLRFNDVGPTNPAIAPTHNHVTLNNVGKPVFSLPAVISGLMLASASLDTTARIWDVQHGQCSAVLSQHAHPVNGIAWSNAEEIPKSTKFTPGTLVATNAHGRVHIWDTTTATLIRTIRCDDAPNEASWNGNQIAFGSSDGSLCITDVKL